MMTRLWRTSLPLFQPAKFTNRCVCTPDEPSGSCLTTGDALKAAADMAVVVKALPRAGFLGATLECPLCLDPVQPADGAWQVRASPPQPYRSPHIFACLC